ncbi:uncharacterized protein LOC134220830 [Armigeres subalbatus]|uniref:uncharacterized protein LOC134220830 n=1 Tax=Armigeres subalbatus TaxID=124917 RepID=UPI002ED08AFB
MYRILALLVLVTIVQALSIDDRSAYDITVNVEKNSNSYFQSAKLKEGTFEYGLDVEKPVDHHFQHKVKGPDGITYGCYGFVDPDGKPHLTHYVSDAKGYRVVAPDHATKIYISRLEKSINNVYQASVEKDVQWKDLFFPPACKTLYAELVQNLPATTPRTPRTTPTRAPTTPRPTAARPTSARITPAFEPDFGASSNLHESVVRGDGSCSQVCNELKGELQEIKSKLKTLIDGLARREAEESRTKSAGGAGGNGTYAYFPVMLSNSLPVNAASGQFALPAFQCGRK